MIHETVEIRKSPGTLTIADSATLHKDVLLDLVKQGAVLTIGEYANIGRRTVIACSELVEIGDYVMIAPDVYIFDADHSYQNIETPILYQPLTKAKHLKIGKNSWIGIHAVILDSVGQGCVIGANSVLTKPTGDYEVWVGSPAKCVKKYNQSTNKWENT